MIVLRFHGHKRYRCPDNCHGCFICEGGLYTCTRCGGAEASLPTDCPGKQIDHDLQDDIAAGQLDYRWREGWVLLDNRGNSINTDAYRDLSGERND